MKTIGEKEIDYGKIKIETDEKLPLNKFVNFAIMTVIIKSVFEEDRKYYSPKVLDECLL